MNFVVYVYFFQNFDIKYTEVIFRCNYEHTQSGVRSFNSSQHDTVFINGKRTFVTQVIHFFHFV